MKFTRSI